MAESEEVESGVCFPLTVCKAERHECRRWQFPLDLSQFQMARFHTTLWSRLGFGRVTGAKTGLKCCALPLVMGLGGSGDGRQWF